MSDTPLITYRLKLRATVRSGPSRQAQPIARLPQGYAFQGRPLAGWIEIVKDGQSAGFVSGTVVVLVPQERSVGK